MTACEECEARRKLARDALFSAKIKEALGHVAKGAAEVAGLKPKTAVKELTLKQTPKAGKEEKV